VQHRHLYVLQQSLPSLVRRLPTALPDQAGHGTLMPLRNPPLAPINDAHEVSGVCMRLHLQVAPGFFSCEFLIKSWCGMPRCGSMQCAAV
jgi:hypothetical protein